MESAVGYHVYQAVWNPAVGERFICETETNNAHDRFAVSVMKDDAIIGHVPRRFSSVCSIFLRKGGDLSCEIMGTKRYSSDLPQGGMEIPCIYVFRGNETDVAKVKKFKSVVFPDGLKSSQLIDSSKSEPVRKKRKVEEELTSQVQSSSVNVADDTCMRTVGQWLQFDRIVVTSQDKDIITSGGLLNDQIMHFAQNLLLYQFRHVQMCGLQSTLLQQSKEIRLFPTGKPVLQVIHCQKCRHWIVASTINIDSSNSNSADVCVYDSLYTSVDDETLSLLKKLFGTHINIKLPSMQTQVGSADCGLFAIATLVALLYNVDPSKQKFNQPMMRQHLITCFERNAFVMFP